jgi:hypothetical protein
MHTVIETTTFLADAKRTGLDAHEKEAMVDFLAANPRAGDEIVGSGGARKLRFAGRGKGKSGGYRVITFFSGPDITVFLLSIFAKGEKANLSKAEINELRGVLSEIVKTY